MWLVFRRRRRRCFLFSAFFSRFFSSFASSLALFPLYLDSSKLLQFDYFRNLLHSSVQQIAFSREKRVKKTPIDDDIVRLVGFCGK